jgi:thymidylate synthase (FAD)
MKVKLLAHTKLSDSFLESLNEDLQLDIVEGNITDGQAIALSAIRTCYSHNEPSNIIESEGGKYFGKVANDGEGGTEADRLIRHIMRSGHLSTTEHINFTFTIEGVSRSLLAQLTRHRHFSYSVQSQRYVKFGSNDKAEGYDYVVPETIKNDGLALNEYERIMKDLQRSYDDLRKLKIPAEDARYVLPNAATCNLVFTGNLRSILEFCSKRGNGTHASAEIQELAELIKEEVVKVEPWTESFFKN